MNFRPSHTQHTWPAFRFCLTTSDRETPVNTPVTTARPPNAIPNVAATPPNAFAAAAPGFLRSKDMSHTRLRGREWPKKDCNKIILAKKQLVRFTFSCPG